MPAAVPPFPFVLFFSASNLENPVNGAVKPGPSHPLAALRHHQARGRRAVGACGVDPRFSYLAICEGPPRGADSGEGLSALPARSLASGGDGTVGVVYTLPAAALAVNIRNIFTLILRLSVPYIYAQIGRLHTAEITIYYYGGP